MNRTLITLAIAAITLLATATPALACRCRTTQFTPLAQRAPLVVHARVSSNKDGVVTFEIQRTIKGETDAKTFEVKTTSSSCRAGLGHFKAGDEYAFALRDPSKPTLLNSCQIPFARVHNVPVVHLSRGEKKTLDDLQKELGKVSEVDKATKVNKATKAEKADK